MKTKVGRFRSIVTGHSRAPLQPISQIVQLRFETNISSMSCQTDTRTASGESVRCVGGRVDERAVCAAPTTRRVFQRLKPTTHIREEDKSKFCASDLLQCATLFGGTNLRRDDVTRRQSKRLAIVSNISLKSLHICQKRNVSRCTRIARARDSPERASFRTPSKNNNDHEENLIDFVGGSNRQCDITRREAQRTSFQSKGNTVNRTKW
jgi:hypothetical protein